MHITRPFVGSWGAISLLLLIGGCGHGVAPSVNADLGSQDLGTDNGPTFELAVSSNNVGGASGKISSTSMPDGDQIDCGTTCTVARGSDAQLTLRATPTSGYYFGGWSGDCTGTAPTCTVSLTQARAVQATFTPANLAFVTSQAYTLDQVKAASTLTGTPTDAQKMLSGADSICRGFGGSNDFYAWLASNADNAATRLPSQARGFVRKDGRQFKDLVTGVAIFYPIRLDENGVSVGRSLLFTGAASDGSLSYDAGDWTGSGYLSSGLASGVGDDWTFYAGGNYSGASERLLCLETRYSAVVTLPSAPAGARFMFASQPIPITNGVGAFDAQCTSEAAANHLPGTYKALIAADGASAASRFTTQNVPIYRTDGAIVADSDTALLAQTGAPDATISVGADARPVPSGTFFLAWVGATNPMEAASSNCHDAVNGDWYSTAGSGSQGDLLDGASWFSGYSFECTGSYSVYCLQQ